MTKDWWLTCGYDGERCEDTCVLFQACPRAPKRIDVKPTTEELDILQRP